MNLQKDYYARERMGSCIEGQAEEMVYFLVQRENDVTLSRLSFYVSECGGNHSVCGAENGSST